MHRNQRKKLRGYKTRKRETAKGPIHNPLQFSLTALPSGRGCLLA
jgi:hypothetical protein